MTQSISLNNLYLIRGLPGSGKSTLAQKIVLNSKNNVMHYEADQFFTHVEPQPRERDGSYEVQYNFDRRLLGAAHDLCYGKTMNALYNGFDAVVANPFVTQRELARYIRGVQRSGLNVIARVIKCTGEYDNVHGVPPQAIARMRDNWEDYPNETPYTGEEA